MLPSGNCIARPASSFRVWFIAAAALLLGAASLQAQHVHYGSFHKHSQAQPQTFSGDAKLRTKFLAAKKSSLSLAVGDLNEDGTRDLVSGYASGAEGVLSVQLGDSNAVAPSTPDATAAHQRGDFRAPFSATATLTSIPVHPDLLKIADVNGDGHLDAIVAAQGGSAIYVLFGDGQGNFAPAVALPVSGAIASLATWRAPGAKFDSIAAGLCADAAHCFVNIYSSDGATLASVAVTGTPTALETAYLNETATRDIAIVSGTDLLLLDGATALTAPHLENLPVQNAVAIAAGQFLYDHRGLLQLAVLTADGSLHILARPGIDAHTLTRGEYLAARRNPSGSHTFTGDPATLGWTDAETLLNVAQISLQPGTGKTILLRGRFTGNGGDGLIVISNGQISRISHTAISDGAAEPSMVSSSTVDIEPADDTTAAVVAPVTPSAMEGLISFSPSISFQPLISMPPTNIVYTVNSFTDALDNLTTTGRCTNFPVQCTLRDAIGLVNLDAASNITNNKMDEIDFAFNGFYTLLVNPGPNAFGDPSIHLEIGGPVNIVGNGSANIIITANGNDRIFSIDSGAINGPQAYDVFISGVTLTGGTNNNNFATNASADYFGGILDWEAWGTGFLTISGSGISDGNVQWGPGGGIAATNTIAGDGVLELDSCTVTSNQTPEIGGGISMGPGGALVLSNTIIDSNTAETTVNSSDPSALGQGGGLFLGSRGSGAQTTITNGSIAGNQSTSDGGGIWTGTGLNMTGTLIGGNTSGGYGGGLFHNTISETTTLSGLTFTTNTAATDGGAIAVGSSNTSSALTMTYSRIHGNTATSGGHAGISVGNGTTGGIATVTDNWWGCNPTDNITSFTGTGCDTGAVLGGGTLTVSPYAALSLNITSATPIYNTSFTATGDLAHDSLGAALGGGNLAAYTGLAATVVIQQNSGSPVTVSGNLDANASAAASTTLTIPGTGTAKITVDGTTVTKSFNVLAPDMTVTSTHTGNFHPGDVGDTYTLTATNSGTSVTTAAVTVTDTLPSGFTATSISSTNPHWVCTLGTLTCTNSVDTAAAAASFTSITVTFSVGTSVTGSFSNSVTVSGGGEPPASTGNDTGTDTTLVIAPPVAAIVFNPVTTPLNSTSSLQFTLTNPSGNTVALTGVAFSVTLPSGLTVATSSTSPCSGTLATTAGTRVIALTGATIASGGTCTYNVTVTGATAGIYSVSTGTPSSTNGGTGVAATNAALTVAAPPTVSTGFGAATIPLNVNAATALTFTITNPNTTVALSGVSFTNTLPSGLIVATPSGATNTCSGTLIANAGSGFITLAASSLATSANCTISVNVTGTTAGVKNNSVTVASTEGGNALSSNASIAVVAPPTISKAFGAPTIPLNGSTSLNFTVANPNTNVALSSVAFTDNLPAGLNVSTPNGLSGTCGSGSITAIAGSSAIQLGGGTLPANSNCIFSVNVKGITAGVQNNVTSTVVSLEGGIGLTASASVTVVAPPTFSAAFGTSPIALGTTSTLTFTITNPNTTVALTGIAFTETLPTGLTVSNVTGPTCGGTITDAAPTSISFSGGIIVPNGNCTIAITVTGATAGIYTATSGNITSTNGGTGTTASANLTVTAPPTVVTAFGASTIPLNGSTSLTFTITNPNATIAFTGLSFTDTLPAGLVIATPNGATNTCNGTLTATAGSVSVSLSAGTLAVSSNCTISVNVTGTTAGVKNNSVTVASIEGGNAIASNASVTVLGPATLAASFGAPTIPLNGSTTATFVVGNPNTTVALTGIGFTDTFPTGLVIATPPGITGTCAGATFSGTAGASIVTFTGGTLSLAASGTCSVSVNVTGTTAGVKSNSTSAPTSTNGGTGTAATSSITVVAPPTISAAFSPTPITVGSTSTLTFTVTNPSTTVTLTGIAFTETLPTGLTVSNVTGPTCGGTITDAAPASISFSGGSIAASGNCTISITVTGATAGIYTATSGTISSTNGGTGLTATANISVASPPTVVTGFGASTIPLNGSTSLSITITNPNSTVAFTGVAFTDTLPAGLVVATPNGASSNCTGTLTATAGAGSISLSGGTLAVSANCTITVNVTGTTAGMKSNSVTVTSTEGGNAIASNASVTVVAPPILGESIGAPTIPLNGSTTLLFTINNPNLSSLSGISFTDTLPAGLVLSATPLVGGNCVGTTTATAGSNSISLSGGNLGPSTFCSITFNVTGITAGVQSNPTGAPTSTEGGTGTAATGSVTVVAPPTLSASFFTNPIAVGHTSVLDLQINNPNSTVTLTGISFTLTLPAGLTTGNSSGSSLCGGTVTVTSNSIITFTGNSNNFTPNSGCGFLTTVTGNTAGAYTVTSSAITSTNGGTGLTASANLSVANPPVTAASFGAAAIPLNGSTTFTIQINNPNTVLGLTGVAFTDTLSSGLVIASTPALSNTCNGTATAVAGSHTIALSGGTLAISATCSITVNVTGTLSNSQGTTVTVTSNEGGAGTGSNASITVVAPPALVASFGSTAVLVGGSASLNFNIMNPNGSPTGLTGIGFTGTLPSGLVIATPNGVTNNCSGTLTATAGSSSIAFSGASLGPAAGCNFSINVTGTAAGLKNFVTSNPTSNEGGNGTVGSSSIQVAATFQAAPATTVGQSTTFTVMTVTATQPVSYSVNTQGATGLDFTLAGSPAPSCTGTNPFVCTVTITYSPKAPGLREGVLLPLDGSSAVLQTVFLSGVGNGPVAVFNQNVQATLASSVNLPAGAVFDAAGNYYYAETGAQRVSKRTPGGVTTVIDNTGLTAPTSVAIDGAGTAYITNSASTVFIIPAGSTCAASSTCATYTGFLTATGVAVDGKGNLYVADKANANITVINIATGVKTTLSAAPLQTHVYDVAVDAAGNLYTADVTGSTVGKFTGATGTIAPVSSAFAGPYSIRTDAANNLYVVDQGGSAGTGRLSFLPAGSSTPQTITVTGTLQPNGVAINAAGTLYVPVSESVLSGSANDNIVTLTRNGATFTVATGTPITTKSATQTATVTNIGSAPLVIASVTPNSVSAVDSTDTPLCTGSIAINASCNIGAQLAPTVTGPTSGVITLVSNTLASPQTVSISGTAVPDTVKLAFGTAPATPITAGGNAGSAITVLEEDVNSATVTSAADSVALSVTYPDNSVHPLGNATAVNGIATFNLSATALTLSGSYHYTASFGTLTSALATEVVNPAATTHYSVASTTVAVVGIAFNATVTALDQFNNTATAYTGTAHITSSDSTATLPANYTFVAGDAGVHIFSVQLNTAATQSVTATDTVTGSITGSQTGIVVGKRSTGTTVAALPVSPVVFGVPVTITATVSPSTAATVNAGGTIQFSDSSNFGSPVALSSGTASITITAPTTGSHSYAAAYTGDSNFAASNTAAALAFTVNKAASSVALITSSSNAGTGIPVTFTATVSDASVGSSGTPTGSVQFFNTVNSVTTPLGSAVTLSGNTAVLTISFSAVASNSITAVYSGDGNFTTNTSNAVGVTTLTPGYTAAFNPSTLNITQGSSGTSVLTLTPFGNYTGTAQFSCTGLPPFASCQFLPSTVTFTGNNAVQTVQVTVFTLNAHTAPGAPSQSLLWFPAAGMLALLITFRRRKLARTLRPLLMLAIAALALTAITGCGSSSSFVTPTGTTIVTAHVGATGAPGSSSGNINQTATITINIQ